MKIRSDYVLRKVAGDYVVLPLGEAVISFNGMLTLNETGAFLWEKLVLGATIDELVSALTKEYGVSKAEATIDVNSFIEMLKPSGCFEG